MSITRWILVFFAAVALSMAFGCNGEMMHILVRSPTDVNAGRPVRVLVRAVDRHEFVNEAYSSAADKVVNHDDSVVYSNVAYPGVPLSATIHRVTGKVMAVYVFFTTPGPRWKAALDPPLPYAVTVELSRNNIDNVERHRW